MTEETTNNSGSNLFGVSDERSIFGNSDPIKQLDFPASVVETFKGLNTAAAEVENSELRARNVTYEYVAKLVRVASALQTDTELMRCFLEAKKKLLGTIIDANDPEKAVNPFNPLVRIADGRWSAASEEEGSKAVKWVHNRSSEKYAGVCRFAVNNKISGDALLEHLLKRKDFGVFDKLGKVVSVKPTLNAIIAFDSKFHKAEGGNRAVLTKTDWHLIFDLKPIATVAFTQKIKSALTLSEGGIGFMPYRIVGNEVHFFGDLGHAGGDPVHRAFKNRREDFVRAYREARNYSDDPATLPEEYEVEGLQVGEKGMA